MLTLDSEIGNSSEGNCSGAVCRGTFNKAQAQQESSSSSQLPGKGQGPLLAVSGSGGQESPSEEGHYRQDKAAECESEEINGVGRWVEVGMEKKECHF